MKTYEKILVIMYVGHQLHRLITRRYLATIVYICSNLLNEQPIDVYDIYPDGVESEEINLYIDYLVSKQYILANKGLLSLTDKGESYVRRLLTNPDNRMPRVCYRAALQVMSLTNNVIIEIASYLFFNQFSDSLKGFSRVKKIYREIKDYISIFMNNEELKKKKVI